MNRFARAGFATLHAIRLFASQEYQEQRRKGLTPRAAAAEATRQVWEHFPTEAKLYRVPKPTAKRNGEQWRAELWTAAGRRPWKISGACVSRAAAEAAARRLLDYAAKFGAVGVRAVVKETAARNARIPKPKPKPATFGRATAVKVKDFLDMTSEEMRGTDYGRLPRGSGRPMLVEIPGRPGRRLVYEVPHVPAFVLPAPKDYRVPAPDDRKIMAARSRAILAGADTPDTRTEKTADCPRCGVPTRHLVGGTYRACYACGKVTANNPGGVPLGAQHIRPGDRVTFVNRFGQQLTGRVVFALPTHLTLNMGGRYGTPAVVNYADVVKVQPRRNPLTRSETGAVLGRARHAGRVARAYAGYSHGVAAAAKMAAYQEVARDFGQGGGPAGRAARRVAAFGPAAPGDPDYRRNVPARVLDAGWAAHKAAKKAGASEADAKAAGLRAVWAQYPSDAAAWGIPQPNPPAILGPIPGRMTQIQYRRTGKHPGPYYHKFGRNVRAFACADGSVLLRGPKKLYVRQ